MKRTLIIGAGASGMLAAIASAKAGDTVTVLERNRKALKKLGITGNGRGNLLNSMDYRYFGDAHFAIQVFKNMPYQSVYNFLTEMGITLTHEADGRIYPTSYLASVAVEAILHKANLLNINIITDTYVNAVHLNKNNIVVNASTSIFPKATYKKSGKLQKTAPIQVIDNEYIADKIIIATGGAAAPMQGTDGSSYQLLTKLGYPLTTIKPALTGLLWEQPQLDQLSGLRLKASLKIKTPYELHSTRGEVLICKGGLSGIAAMQLARFYVPNSEVILDIRESILGSENKDLNVLEWLENRVSIMQTNHLEDLFIGTIPKSLAQFLCKTADYSLKNLSNIITEYHIPLTGVRDFEQAQVTAGGFETDLFSPLTLASKKEPRLHVVGEALNVDGDCGGYNLLFAFATGILAGEAK